MTPEDSYGLMPLSYAHINPYDQFEPRTGHPDRFRQNGNASITAIKLVAKTQDHKSSFGIFCDTDVSLLKPTFSRKGCLHGTDFEFSRDVKYLPA